MKLRVSNGDYPIGYEVLTSNGPRVILSPAKQLSPDLFEYDAGMKVAPPAPPVPVSPPREPRFELLRQSSLAHRFWDMLTCHS